jgi:squalene-hopene/tetraprenyl-beta-curcumene cyclase
MYLHRLAWLAFPFLLLPASAQEHKPATPPAKFGTILKDQVDGLVNGLCERAAPSGALGDGSCLSTAKVLAAMGHCHRFYSLGDGPVVRKPLAFLFQNRRADGSFANADGSEALDTTAWVVAALAALEPNEHRRDIEEGSRWLAKNAPNGAAEPLALARHVAEVQTRMAKDGRSPTELGADAARRAMRGLVTTAAAEPDLAASVATLVELVACQVAAREADRGLDRRAAAAGALSPAQGKAFAFLLTQQKDGMFFVRTPGGPVPDLGLTGLGLAALQTKPPALRTADEQTIIDQGLRTMVAAQNEDGSFGTHVVNYTTCAVVAALSAAGREEYAPVLANAQKYLVTLQNVEHRGYARGDRDYGSIGYGNDQRGDLSNLQMAVEALRQTGLDRNHEAFAKAIVFLQRTQNLREVNDFTAEARDEDTGDWVRVQSGDDGGSAYYPGNSPAGYVTLPDGTKLPRSYGSMTYALLKTYVLAGLDPDDKRIRAATRWLESNWTLDENPGSDPLMDPKTRYQGLYYYYMVMAQALDTAGVVQLAVPKKGDEVATAAVDWRKALRQHLEKLQAEDGSWVNDRNGRWWEGQATICTIYAMLALQRCGG